MAFYQPRSHHDISLWKGVSDADWENPDWQRRHTITAASPDKARYAVDDISQIITLSGYKREAIENTIVKRLERGQQVLRITPYYASLMDQDPFGLEDRIDPIFLQAVPMPADLLFSRAGIKQAMAEQDRSKGAAYQRYLDRVVLFLTNTAACENYCQHCQRRRSLHAGVPVTKENIDEGIDYIMSNKNIKEAILSGGEPLAVKERLLYAMGQLSQIDHVERLRIGTRMPVTLPMGVTDELLEHIKHAAGNKMTYFVTHTNHMHEVTDTYAAAADRIRNHGFDLLNQLVLLKGVNDDFATFAKTHTEMWRANVNPYYAFICHKERGLAHFITPVPQAKLLLDGCRGMFGGTAIPRLAMNAESGAGKVWLMPKGPSDIDPAEAIKTDLESWDGTIIKDYEHLGRATREEFDEAERVMEAFIGRPDVFKPSLLIEKDGELTGEVTNLDLTPLSFEERARRLGYTEPLITNPAE